MSGLSATIAPDEVILALITTFDAVFSSVEDKAVAHFLESGSVGGAHFSIKAISAQQRGMPYGRRCVADMKDAAELIERLVLQDRYFEAAILQDLASHC